MILSIGEKTMTESKIKEKRFTPEDEKIILEEFSKDYDFTYDINSTKKTFSIDTPPAYPSGDPHPGQMAHYMKIDMIARTARMQGYEVLFPMGLDRNGIQLEMLVEKKHGKKMQDMDREFFVNECKTEMDKIGKVIYDFFKRAGVSADFDHDYATDSDEYRAFSQAQFIKMWNQGLIKEDLRPNMYCPGCKTSIAEAEIVYEELPTMMNTLKFKVVETGEEIHVGTTRYYAHARQYSSTQTTRDTNTCTENTREYQYIITKYPSTPTHMPNRSSEQAL